MLFTEPGASIRTRTRDHGRRGRRAGTMSTVRVFCGQLASLIYGIRWSRLLGGGSTLQDLDEAVTAYLDVAGRIFQQAKQHAQPQPAIRVLWSSTQLLRQAIAASEKSEAFAALVGAAVDAYEPTHPMMGYLPWTRAAVTSFFCRSGVYSSQFSGESISPRVVADSFQSAFSATTHRVKYLAPLELVSFGAETIDCGSYQIRRYPRQQLDDLVENDMRSVFDQNLRIDTAALEPYWFIVVEGTEPHPLCADPSIEELESSRPIEFSP